LRNIEALRQGRKPAFCLFLSAFAELLRLLQTKTAEREWGREGINPVFPRQSEAQAE
jgi:hypothetical protein